MSSIYPEKLPWQPTDEELIQAHNVFVASYFGITDTITWEPYTQTNPDSFVYVFTANNQRYALAYDDYPSSFSDLGSSRGFAKALRTKEGGLVLNIQKRDESFSMGVVGAFMLFLITDDEAFDDHLYAAKKSYEKWREESGGVEINTNYYARDILQLAETAAENHDMSALYSLQNIMELLVDNNIDDSSVNASLLSQYVKILLDAEFGYEFSSPEEKQSVGDKIYKALSQESQLTIDSQKYTAKNLGDTVTLVSALYSRDENGVTSGLTASVVVKGRAFEYPLSGHPLNGYLDEYFSEMQFITDVNIADHMPEKLDGYTLIAGTVEVQKIFRRELPYLNF